MLLALTVALAAALPAPATELAAVRPGAQIALYSRPGGKLVARVGDRTVFGSPRVFSVIADDGRWLAVSSELSKTHRVYLRRDAASLRFRQTDYALVAHLRTRRTCLLRDGRELSCVRVAIGAPQSPTPTGRFAVTDRLSGPEFGSAYGCCILALSGTQPHPPAWFKGPNRLAIHGTNSPSSLGRAVSAGCLRAPASALRRWMRTLPLGTPVYIQTR